MWCGTIGHNNVLGVGRMQDWASHLIEHELSALYDIAHGAGLAIIIPAWMQVVSRQQPGFFTHFAREIFGIDTTDQTQAIALAIQRTKDWFCSLGLPTTLSEAGITDAPLELIAQRAAAVGGGTIGGFVPLKEADILEILACAG